MAHRGDQLLVGLPGRFFPRLALDDTFAHGVNAGGQLTQLVPAFYRDRVLQVTALQQGQLFFQLVDVPGLAADGQQKQH